MSLTKEGYRTRLIDERIKRYLTVFGAISIEGPKWCGKTWTSLNHANSVAYVTEKSVRNNAEIDPKYIFMKDRPQLIDEWQIVPGIWDAVRNECDSDHGKGKFILTGSTSLKKRRGEEKVYHSGTGRIAPVRMHPMSLYESGDSTGEASLQGLLCGEEPGTGEEPGVDEEPGTGEEPGTDAGPILDGGPDTEPKTDIEESPEVPGPGTDVETEPEIKQEPEKLPETEDKHDTEVKPETEPEAKPEVRPETEPEDKPETKPEVRPESGSEVTPEVKPEAEPETKPEDKPETKPEVKPENKPENVQNSLRPSGTSSDSSGSSGSGSGRSRSYGSNSEGPGTVHALDAQPDTGLLSEVRGRQLDETPKTGVPAEFCILMVISVLSLIALGITLILEKKAEKEKMNG